MFEYMLPARVLTQGSVIAAPHFPIDKIGTWLSAALHSSLDSVVVIDATGRIVLLNREAGRLFDCPVEQLAGELFENLFPFSLRKEQSSQLLHFATSKMTTGRRLRVKLDLHGMRTNGDEMLLSAAVARVTIEEKVFLAIILRELREQAVSETQQNITQTAFRKLSLSSQQASEIEKRRVSKALYDDLGQSLSVLKLDLDWLERSAQENKTIAQRIAQMQMLLDDVLVRTKNIAAFLRPSLLDDFGLLPAVEWITTSFAKRTGIHCTLMNDGIPNKPGDQVESAVFRVIQESLLNIERHAQASHVKIHLWHTDQHLHLEVGDDGIGLDENSRQKQGCHGLSAMQERIYTLGGTLSIRNNKMCGLEIHAAIPFQS